MERTIRREILKRFDNQGDFAQKLGMNETQVSRVLHGRRKLTRDEAKAWADVLECDPAIFNGVTSPNE